MNLIVWIVLGAIAGWIAGLVMKSNHGLLEDIILGIVGAFVGGFVFSLMGEPGVTGFNVYSLIVSVIGAVIVIFIGRVLHK